MHRRWLFMLTTVLSVAGAVEAQQLRVYEPFAYATGEVEPAEGGIGWSGPWRANVALTIPLSLPVMPGESLPSPAGHVAAAGSGRLMLSGGAMAWRGLGLGQELPLADNRPWYLSFVTRSRGDDSGQSRSMHLMLHNQFTPVVGIGHSSSGRLSVIGDEAVSVGGDRPAVSLGHSYLWVVKLTPERPGRRRVQVHLYHADRPVDRREPASWMLTSGPLEHAGTIDRLGVTAGGHLTLEIDEIRIGTSWPAVTGAGGSR